MKFENPATINPIDQLKIIGHPTDRIDGPLKTTGTARYAYERDDVVTNPAYGYVLGSAIAKGRITSMDLSRARAAPGVLAVVGLVPAAQIRAHAVNRSWDRQTRSSSPAWVATNKDLWRRKIDESVSPFSQSILESTSSQALC